MAITRRLQTYTALFNLIIQCFSTFGETIHIFKRVLELEDEVSSAFVLNQQNTPVKGMCSVACMQDLQCQSFFYNSQSGQCVTLSAVLTTSQNTSPSIDTSYHVRIQRSCPLASGYTYVDWLPLCYKLYKEPMNQTDASSLCGQEGGHLAKVNTPQKEQYLSGLGDLRPSGHAFVDGRCDSGGNVHTDYRQLDGSPITYFQWGYEQPNGVCWNNCLCIRPRGFNDIPCGDRKWAICEFPL